jgi:hypothetical protein
MTSRVKILGVVALLGFLAGIIAQVTADYIIPWLMVVLPALINVKWVVSGVAGAFITVGLVAVWAYMSKNKEGY